MLTEQQIGKINRIKEELKRGLADFSKESVFFDYFKLANIPLLNDQMGLKKILEIIVGSSNNKISYREVIGQRRATISAANSNPELLAPAPIGLEIHVEDKSKIDEYFDLVLKGSIINNIPEIEIKSLRVAKHKDDSRITVIINEKYSQGKIQPLTSKGRWKILLEVVENGSAEADTKKQAKSVIEYFNTNKKCMIYSKYPEYKLTKILKADDEQIYPNIETELMSQKTFIQRKNKTT